MQNRIIIHFKLLIMSKFDEVLAKYEAEVKKLNLKIDSSLLQAVTKGLGPSIYNVDAETIASSDPSELATVKNNFLIKKLGLSDGPALDSAIEEVIEMMGKSNRSKYRAIFYALLTIKFKKESVYA